MNKSKIVSVMIVAAVLLVFGAAASVYANGQTQTGSAVVSTRPAVSYDAQSPTGGLTLPLTSSPMTYSYLGPNSSQSNASSWPIWNYIKEATGISLDANATHDFADKVKVLIASGNMPDMFLNMYTYLTQGIDSLGEAGVLLPLDKYFAYMPNLKHYIDTHPEVKKEITSPDGHIYSTPAIGIVNAQPAGVTLYRKDVFDTYGITPKWDTQDDFFNTLMALKQKTPNYYPMTTTRSDWGFYFTWGLMYGSGDDKGIYYNDIDKKWEYDFIQPNFKAELQFINKLQNNGLLDPQWLTNGGKLFWSTFGKTPYQGGAVFIQNLNWLGPTGYTKWSQYDTKGVMDLELIPPFKTGLAGARQAYPDDLMVDKGFLVSAKVKDPALLCEMIDYVYSPQGSMLADFGKEGVDYKLDNGFPVPLGGGNGTASQGNILNVGYPKGFGFGQGFSLSFPTSILKPPYLPQKEYAAWQYMLNNNMSIYRTPRILFNQAQLDYTSTELTNLNKYALAAVDRFATGQTPFSEWDSFVAKVKSMGVEDMLNVYNQVQQKQNPTP